MKKKTYFGIAFSFLVALNIVAGAVYVAIHQSNIPLPDRLNPSTDTGEPVGIYQADEGWATYVNGMYGYLIKYPGDASVTVARAGSGETYETVRIESPNFSTSILPLLKTNKGQDLEVFAKEYLQIYQGHRLISVIPTKVGAYQEGVIISVEWRGRTFVSAFAERDATVFRVDLSEGNLAQQVFKTFRFVNPVADRELLAIIESGGRYAASKNPAGTEFDASLIRQAGSYALLKATPRYQKSGTVQIILQNVGGTWQGLAIGPSLADWKDKVPELFR